MARGGNAVFELCEKIVEQIVFAMEDQERDSVVDLESGEVLPGEGHSGEGYAKPPIWSSREGFKLMEDFLASVRQPSARRELSAALARGRGVFKAFKAVLAENQELERAFRDFKIRAMRRTIGVWYDDLREAKGLERLGPEPDDTDELVLSDLDIGILDLGSAKPYLLPLIQEAEEESIEYLPGPLAAFEIGRLKAGIEAAESALCAVAYDGEGGALGAALGYRTVVGERGFGRVVFLMVKREFRRMGLGTTLLESLTKAFAKEGMLLVALDSALLPPDFGPGLEPLGYKTYGLRALTRQD
jgi:ribosomal protein S18 acetylase RimI-like enzyme